MTEIGVQMSYSIRYFRPGKREDAGLLIIANVSEFAVHKARLEASGFVVLDKPVAPPFGILATRAP